MLFIEILLFLMSIYGIDICLLDCVIYMTTITMTIVLCICKMVEIGIHVLDLLIKSKSPGDEWAYFWRLLTHWYRFDKSDIILRMIENGENHWNLYDIDVKKYGSTLPILFILEIKMTVGISKIHYSILLELLYLVETDFFPKMNKSFKHSFINNY